MRLHRGVPMLAAALTLAASAPAAADGAARVGYESSGGTPRAFTQHQPGGSDGWLIAAGAAGGAVVLGGGMTVRRHRTRDRQHVPAAPTA